MKPPKRLFATYLKTAVHKSPFLTMASLRKISGNYYAYFYDKNRSPQRKSVPLQVSLKSAAQKRLKYLEEQWAKGTFDPWADDPFGHAENQMTVTNAVEQFLESKSHLRSRTLDTYRQQLEAWTDNHTPPGLRLLDVDADHLKPYVWQSDISTASKGKRYRHLRAFLNWAAEAGYLSSRPLDDVEKPKKEKKSAAFLATDELERLLTCIDVHHKQTENAVGERPDVQWLKDIIRVAVCTGLRRGELVRLRWTEVDLTQRLLTVRSRDGEKTKSGHERQLPLRGDALDVLRRRHTERDDGLDGPVFTDRRGLPIKPDRATKRFKFFVRKAKLKGRERLRFHSLRHTCGSWLAMKGVPMRVIQAILGHSSVSVTERYSHLQPEVMGAAMEEAFGN